MIDLTAITTCSHEPAASRGRFCVSPASHASSFVNTSFMHNAGFWYPGPDTAFVSNLADTAVIRTKKYHRPREASMT